MGCKMKKSVRGIVSALFLLIALVYLIQYTLTWPPRPLTETEYDRLQKHRGSPCHSLSYAHPPLPVTALLSYPRSGNTWFRHLLQEATGLVTGSVYPEQDIPAGSRTDGRVVVVKSHQIDVGIKNCSRAVILIRNPDKALISYYRFMMQENHVIAPNRNDWKEHIARETRQWFMSYTIWLQLPMPKLVVVYNDLLRDLRGEMRRVIQFLNLTVTDAELECMMQNSEGRAHQKPYNMTLYPFSENDIRNIRTHVSDINEILLQNHFNQMVNDGFN